MAREDDNTLAWRLLGQAYASQGKEGEARLATAEYYFAAGAEEQATQFALRARDMLTPRTRTNGAAPWTSSWRPGATMDDIDDVDRRNERRRERQQTVIPPGA